MPNQPGEAAFRRHTPVSPPDLLVDLPRIAAVLGRILLRRFAIPWILLDAEAPVAGLPGRFFSGRAPRYARGPHPVGLGDLAYSEFVLFGR